MKRIFVVLVLLCAGGKFFWAQAQVVKINTNFVVESDGTIRSDGDASTWDDILVPFTQAKQGSNLLPAFDYDFIGLVFPRNAATQKIYMVVQIPHSYKLGSEIHPHIHWQQTSATIPTWKMDYKWFNNGEAVPGTFTTITASATGVFAYSSGNMTQICSFPPISGAANLAGGGLSPGVKNISSILLVKLYRDDTLGEDNVLGFQFDVHYEKDTQGSRLEFTK